MNINERIVVVSGGSGGGKLVQMLKHHRQNISLLQTAFDCGGDSRFLMDTFGIPPVGDFRNGLTSIADVAKNAELINAFKVRLKLPPGKEKSDLEGRSIGNLVILALIQHYGNVPDAFAAACRMFKLSGPKIYPISIQRAHLKATFDNGDVIYGEDLIDTRDITDPRTIVALDLDPQVDIFPPAEKAIIHARKIIYSWGDFYTSLIPNVRVRGHKEAVKRAKHAKIFLTVNIMTKKSETHGYTTGVFAKHLSDYLDRKIDVVLCNTAKIPPEIRKHYEAQGAYPVEHEPIPGVAETWATGNFADWSSGSIVHNEETLLRILRS